MKTNYGDKNVSNLSIGSVIGGMRGLNAMLYDTSSLDPESGITYRGFDLH